MTAQSLLLTLTMISPPVLYFPIFSTPSVFWVLDQLKKKDWGKYFLLSSIWPGFLPRRTFWFAQTSKAINVKKKSRTSEKHSWFKWMKCESLVQVCTATFEATDHCMVLCSLSNLVQCIPKMKKTFCCAPERKRRKKLHWRSKFPNWNR